MQKSVVFDPNNQEHLDYFRKFLNTGKWVNGCYFKQEFPWNNIPDMIKDKVTRHFLGVN